MSRSLMRLGRYALTCGAATLACAIPTSVCGCTPSRSSVFVRGSLTDAAGQAVAGARLYFDGAPLGQATSSRVYVDGPGDAGTDASGAFQGRVFSVSPPGPLALRVAVVQAGLPDTVRLTVGSATFRNQRDTPDTVSISVRLP